MQLEPLSPAIGARVSGSRSHRCSTVIWLRSSDRSISTRICELSKSESAALRQFLAAKVAKPEFTVRWRWKPFDLAFWDNRLTQHYATADYAPHRRVMHRATILGDRPR